MSGSLSGTSSTHVGLFQRVTTYHSGDVQVATDFAKALVPPTRRYTGLVNIGLWMGGCGLGIPILLIVLRDSTQIRVVPDSDFGICLLFVVSGCVGAFIGSGISQPEQRRLDEKYRQALDRWKQSWICARCGHTWILDGSAPA